MRSFNLLHLIYYWSICNGLFYLFEERPERGSKRSLINQKFRLFEVSNTRIFPERTISISRGNKQQFHSLIVSYIWGYQSLL